MNERRFLLAVFALAFLLRLGFGLAYGLGAPPTAWGDDREYDTIATDLAFHDAYVDTWFPPGYPLFLALLYRLFGHSLAAVRLTQAALSALTCCVLYAIGRSSWGAAAGRLAAVLLAFYPGHIYMAWRLMAETLFTLIVALAVLATQHLVGRRGAAFACAVGGLLAAAELIKSNLLFLAPLLLVWLALARPSQGSQRRWSRPSALAAGFCLVLLVVPAADLLSPAGRQLPWRPANGGHTLWWANNPLADGYFVDPDATEAGQAFRARHGVTAAATLAAGPYLRDRQDLGLALAWVREDPRAFLALAPRKLWNAYGPLPRAEVIERSATARWVQLFAFGMVLPLSLAGMALSAGRAHRQTAIFLLLASSVAMTVIGYGTPRFTLPIVPYLLLFAAGALIALAQWARGGRRAEARIEPGRTAGLEPRGA